MTIPAALTLAMDAQFRELSNFITPPRAGKITAIEGNGQVRVATDDPDGGDVLAWPLNGLRYAVDDVVYLTFAVNNPESAIVLGSKGTVPARHELAELSVIRDLAAAATSTPVVEIHQDNAGDDQPVVQVTQDGSGALLLLKDGSTTVLQVHDGGRLDIYNILRALTSSGLRLEDDGGNLGVFIKDGGLIGINTADVEAWDSAFGAMQLGSRSAIMFDKSGSRMDFADNAYFDGDWRYRAAGEAMIFTLRDGGFAIFNAGSGSADAVISWNLRYFLTNDGLVGIGTSSPQGIIHSYQNGGGLMHVVKTAVGSTPQVIIPNGTGDVTRAAHVTFVLTDGTSAVANTFTLVQGTTMSVPTSVGGSTWTVTLNANGQVSVARTSGSATATINFVIVWM